ncbi:alpha/beta hydrolase [Zhongshania borealis]|uniref:AB hydrolase-1 domain-containing protein n=1 Tax=Zhongshania borealis TaxID=889488 RepID=A0ABP7X4E0_9GAMM
MAIKHWVFLRGLGREQAHWGDFIDRCATQLNWQCHCIDLPGFGSEHQRPSPTRIQTIREDVAQRLPATLNNGTPFGIVALSLGGMVALDWLANNPEQIAKVILINTSTGDCPLFQRLKLSALPRAIGALLAPSIIARERATIAMVSNRHSRDPSLLAIWCKISKLRPVSRINVLRQLLAASRYRAPATLASTSHLLISSQADRMVSYRCSEFLASKYAWPITLHNSAGHDLPVDDAEWLINVFAEQLNT